MQEYEVEFKSTTHLAYRVKAPSKKFAEEYAIEKLRNDPDVSGVWFRNAEVKRVSQMKLDYDKIDDVVVEGIDHSDSPDYVDAYIASAKYDDPVNGYRDLTEDELESLDGEWVRQQVEDWIH